MSKNKGGRPPLFNNSLELDNKVDEYFENCKGEYLLDDDGKYVLNKYGEPIVINSKPPNVAGLALYLGFASKQSLYDYQKRKQFSYSITRALSMLEDYSLTRAYDRDGARGAEFVLRCGHGWKEDKDNLPGEKNIESIQVNFKRE